MQEIIGQRVRADDGTEGQVVAVAHAGGGTGTGGWQLLLLGEDDMLAAVDARNARIVRPSGPFVS
jgi:hypothetical protein